MTGAALTATHGRTHAGAPRILRVAARTRFPRPRQRRACVSPAAVRGSPPGTADGSSAGARVAEPLYALAAAAHLVGGAAAMHHRLAAQPH